MFDEPDRLDRIAMRAPDPDGPDGVGAGWLVALLYLTSFFLPVDRAMFGVVYFLCGGFATLVLLPATILGLFAGDAHVTAKDLGECLPWLANPVLWFGLQALAVGRPRRAALAGAVALPLALSFLLSEPRDLRAGYHVWAGSMALLLLAGVVGCLRERGGPVRPLPDAGPKFAAARMPPPDRGRGVQRPTESLRPPP